MSPKRVDRSEKRRQILDAAERVFSKKGFHSAKMDDIAREADVGKGTIYEYFKSREELPLALFTDLFGPLVDYAFVEIDSDPVDSVVRIAKRSLDGLDRFKKLTPIFLGLFAEKRFGISAVMKAASTKMFNAYTQRLVAVIERGQAEGKIAAEIDPKAFSRLMVSAVDGIGLHYLLFDLDPKFFGTQVFQLERMIRAALRPHPSEER